MSLDRTEREINLTGIPLRRLGKEAIESFEDWEREIPAGHQKRIAGKQGQLEIPPVYALVQGSEVRAKLTKEKEEAIDRLIEANKGDLNAEEQKKLRAAVIAYATGDVSGLYCLVPKSEGYSPKVTGAFRRCIEAVGGKVETSDPLLDPDKKERRDRGELIIITPTRGSALRLRIAKETDKDVRYSVDRGATNGPRGFDLEGSIEYDSKGPVSYIRKKGAVSKPWDDKSEDARQTKLDMDKFVADQAENFRLYVK
ncbi:MAG: hypothetical protein C5B53_08575 [Candidatus Melainabacteria bacterium]|nr:MAG: hypothetical protein C5B53_08575 [Candidatus Melainabacteria bacterium]